MIGSLRKLTLSIIPWLVIAGLLYVALFVKPKAVGHTVQPSAIENRDRFFGIAVVNGSDLWLAGADGKIVRSDQQRSQWTVQPVPKKVHFQDIASWDTQRAVAVGNGGTIIYTENGGESWLLADAPTNDVANKLIDVKVYEGGEAWAVGEYGTILRSADFGQHWKPAREQEDVILNEIIRVDADTLMVVGEFGLILRSVDNGASWQSMSAPTENSLTAISFRDAVHGAIAGLQGVRLATGNGGVDWQLVGERVDVEPEVTAQPGSRPGDMWQDPVTEHIFALQWVASQNSWVATGAKGVWLSASADLQQWQSGRLSETEMSWHTAIAASDEGLFFSGQNTGLWRDGLWSVIGEN